MTRYEFKVLTPGQAINEANLNALGAEGFHIGVVMTQGSGGRVILQRTVEPGTND